MMEYDHSSHSIIELLTRCARLLYEHVEVSKDVCMHQVGLYPALFQRKRGYLRYRYNSNNSGACVWCCVSPIYVVQGKYINTASK